MASFDDELLNAAALLLRRRSGQRGALASAQIRRSISTTYYAMFHFILDEVGRRTVGSSGILRQQRQLLVRGIDHKDVKTTLDKCRGVNVDSSVADLFRSPSQMNGPVGLPRFTRDFAVTFIDAQAKRLDADYNLSESLSEADARLLRVRALFAIKTWRISNDFEDKKAKNAICRLILMRGQLRQGR